VFRRLRNLERRLSQTYWPRKLDYRNVQSSFQTEQKGAGYDANTYAEVGISKQVSPEAVKPVEALLFDSGNGTWAVSCTEERAGGINGFWAVHGSCDLRWNQNGRSEVRTRSKQLLDRNYNHSNLGAWLQGTKVCRRVWVKRKERNGAWAIR
jgi:hypothetical protein